MRKGLCFSIAILLLLVLSGCIAEEAASGGEDWVILSEEGTAVLQYLGFPGERWVPDPTQVMEVDAALPVYLQEAAPELTDKLGSYTRQYGGVTGREGQQLIYVNFFCDAHRWNNWRSELVDVMDGGNCYFHTVYDVNGRSFLSLSINGES